MSQIDTTPTNIRVNDEFVCRGWLEAKFEQVYRQAVLDERREQEFKKNFFDRKPVDHALSDILETSRRRVARYMVDAMIEVDDCQYCDQRFGTEEEKDTHEETCDQRPEEHGDEGPCMCSDYCYC